MSSPTVHRLIRGSLAATLLAGLLAVPAAAGDSTVRWVDDDGDAGPGGCGGIGMAYDSIALAAMDSLTGDTIRVCPGEYLGSILVETPGVTISAVDPGTAVVSVEVITAGRPAGVGSALLTIAADDTTVSGLAFEAPAPAVGPTGGCALDSIIDVVDDSDRVRISGNRMRATGPDTIGSCGYRDGIAYREGSSGLVIGNTIRDFTGAAIAGTEPGTFLKARENVIRFWHVNEAWPVEMEAPSPGGGGDDCWYGAGIVLSFGAKGRIVENEVVGLSSAGKTTPVLCPGIYLEDAGDGIIVRDNLVRFAYDGINTDGTDAFTLQDNRVFASRNEGILVPGSRRAIVDGNTVRGSWHHGIFVPAAPAPPISTSAYGPRLAGVAASRNITFRGNRSHANLGRDCRDGSVGTKSKGTANTWAGNRSDGNDSPDGICPAG